MVRETIHIGDRPVKSVSIEELLGRKVNMLTIVAPAEKHRKTSARQVLCQCDCGGTKVVRVHSILKGKPFSCGCFIPTRPAENLVGQVFGRLTVLSESPNRGHEKMVVCRCGCGKETIVAKGHLKSGHTYTCGCYRTERTKELFSGLKSKHPEEYNVWAGMHQRCENPNSESYKNYGGRGISVDPSWESFECFFRDMGPRPTAHHTIERVDNDGRYSPENCVWLLKRFQSRNTRLSVWDVEGKQRALYLVLHGATPYEVADLVGVRPYNVYQILAKYKSRIERA